MKPFDPIEFDTCLVLTADERLARSLRAETSLIQSIVHQKSWVQRVEILSVSSWLESTWDCLLETDQLLKPIQELALIKNVIDSSGGLPDRMISTSQVARQVLKAINLCNRYQIEIGTEEYYFKPEYQQISRWKSQVDLICKNKGLVMQSTVMNRLMENHLPSDYMANKRIVIVGSKSNFDSSFHAFLSHLCESQIEVHWRSQPSSGVANNSVIRPKTTHAEYVSAACWANGMLENYIGSEVEAPRIAFALKDKFRESAQFCHVLHEHCGNPTDTTGIKAWDVVGVSSLGENPLMAEAFEVISLSLYDNSLEDISRILRSRTLIGANSEASFRARIDLKMREILGRKVHLPSLLKLINTISPEKSSHIVSILQRLSEAIQATDALQYPSEWADHFNGLLNISGWLSSEDKSSEYMQVIAAYNRCLATFSSLDRQLGSINRSRAQMWLREILDTTQFQAKLPYIAPITVMGWEDIGAEQFDHIYVLGVSDSALPGEISLNPFIPPELQEQAGVPGSSSDLLLEEARHWITSVQSSALNSVIFSCSAQDEFGSPQTVSGLVNGDDLVEVDISASYLHQRVGSLYDVSVDNTDLVPSIAAEELKKIKGGTSIIRDYVMSPFVAFARYRLCISPMPEEVVGITAKEQGIALHDTLERFWKRVGDSICFMAMSDDELQSVIADCVDETFKYTRELSIDRFGKSIISLEILRLEELVAEWLNKEKQRTEAFTVIGVEELAECDIYGLPLKLRLDRIDKIETAEGDRYLVIDYKTGSSVSASKLNASEFSEPQLPIYALHGHKKSSVLTRVDGICLAQVVADRPSFHMRSSFANSVVSKRGHASDVATEGAWNNQKDAWDRVLKDSVEGFKAGIATAHKSKLKDDGTRYLLPFFSHN